MQAGRDSFHDSSAAHLPGSVIDNLPVSLLLLPLFFFPLQPAATATPMSLPSQRPPAFVLSVQGLSPEMCTKLQSS